MVITTEKETINSEALNRFVTASHCGLENYAILVHYNGDDVDYVYALLMKYGRMECVKIQNGQKTPCLFASLQFENGTVYGADSKQIKTMLASNVVVTAADMDCALGFINDIHAKIYYLWGPSLTQKVQMKIVSIQKAQLIQLLKANNDTTESKVLADAFSVLDIHGNCEGFICRLYSDGGVEFTCNGFQFISHSKELYDGIFKLSKVERFSLEDLSGIRSITIKRKLSNGEIHTKTIGDAAMVGQLTNLLKNAKRVESHSSFMQPDVELILHANNRDYVCHLYSVVKEELYDGGDVVVVNRFYSYLSPEFMKLVRSMLE
jgi:hypothetical protein